MSGKTARKLRKEVRRSYEANADVVLARVIKKMEQNPNFALAVHTNALAESSGGKIKRAVRRLYHAWRIIDTSPVVLKWSGK
jgi:hypothetical protein